jgi:hypothetical protein
MRTYITLIIYSIIFLVAGCSIGINTDSTDYPYIKFAVPTGYQEAYRRAEIFARQCHTSTNPFKGSFNVSGNLFTDNHSGVVRINLPSAGRDLEIIKIRSINDNLSEITIIVWGVGIWDEKEMLAAKQSILTGTPTCK